MQTHSMQNLRWLGGGAGMLAGIAAVWLLVGLAVAFPIAGLGLNLQDNPNKYLPFIAQHPIMFWLVNVLGGLLTPLLALVLLLALGDLFREEAPAQSQIGVALGSVGVIGFAIGALLREVGLGSLGALYASSKTTAVTAFYALSGTANSFLALGDVALGLSALVFGNVMLGTNRYSRVGYLAVLAGTTLVLSGFVPHEILFLIASVLIAAWLGLTGTLVWQEASGLGGHRRRHSDHESMGLEKLRRRSTA